MTSDPCTLTFRGEDPLLSAVGSGDVRKVQNILTGEETPRTPLRADADGWTALHEASYYGRAECLKLLLTGEEALMQNQEVEENYFLSASDYQERFRSGVILSCFIFSCS